MNLDAIHFAEATARTAHAGQFRRDGRTPYISHVADVVNRVVSAGGTEHEIAAAWLHDVLEDTPTTAPQLYALGVNEEVLRLVHALTKKPDMLYSVFMAQVADAGESAVKIKIADICSNLSDTPTPRQLVKYGKALAQLGGWLTYMAQKKK